MWLDYKVLIFARFTKVWNFNKSEDLGHRSTGTTIKAFFVSEREREKGRKREREREKEKRKLRSLIGCISSGDCTVAIHGQLATSLDEGS